VVATGVGTKLIRNGDLIRVDGDVGVVTILERAGDPATAGTLGAGAAS
jgi:hypothetical protein